MKKNLYVEQGKWVFFWGLFLDRKVVVQETLDKYNLQGWNCVQFEFISFGHYTIFKILLIFLVSLISLGIVTYWPGFFFVFEKEIQGSVNESSNTDKEGNTYAEWKKQNPDKSLNDYYRRVK